MYIYILKTPAANNRRPSPLAIGGLICKSRTGLGLKVFPKSNQKSTKLWTKIYQKSNPKSMKMTSKIQQNRSMRLSWGDFGGTWCHLGCKLEVLGLSWLQVGRSWADLGPKLGILGRFGLQVGAQNRIKSVPRAIWKAIIFSVDLKIDFGSDLVPTWPHLGRQNHPKMMPSWLQNRCKLGRWFDSCFGWDLGTIFIEFCTQHNMAEVTNVL